ncbi:MAG TPA: 3-methyl-2-oxobutanoate hydroxymethyltransferase [Methylophilaceae bacterium]|nr:3-methyl-2-oxobutanoate hydroxymethyltransferase [Methylophilaceae bacterium]HQR60152.1 3-methyl-2-oxobutanoate hydroxymethyltransferase [Methylophilaceae bacterium]
MTGLDALQAMKTNGEKIAVLTCYDASFATLMAQAGVDALLVGDSLGMVLQGAGDTLSVAMRDMEYHTRCVAAGAKSTPVVADMPAGSDRTPGTALDNARRLIEAGAHMVKLEGCKTEVVRHLAQHHIPVCGHLGFTPQSVYELGGYKVQGRDEAGARQILEDSLALQQAGAGLLVLEMVPAALAATVTAALAIPTIGIGAGPDCDGQVLVLHDMLGIYPGKTPRFARNFLQGAGSVQTALTAYVQAVKDKTFPAAEHSF